MGNLEALEDVERQRNFLGNEHKPKYRRRFGSGWTVPANLLNAKVARSEKPVAEASRPAAPIAPAIEKPPSPVGRLIATYLEFVDVCRDRADELEIPRSEIDRIAGLADGHSAHLLARRFIKTFTPQSLPLMLDVLGLRLRIEEDPALTAKTLKRRKRRDRSHSHYPPQFPAINGAINGRLNYGYPPPDNRQALDSCAEEEATAA
jgi:hypothetical protein